MEVLQRTANRGSISTGYDIDNSLKLNSASSEYLYITRDASGSDWNRLLWTASMWVKHIPTEDSATAPKERLFGAADANSDFDIRFRGQPIGFRNNSDVDGVGELRTNALYRDYSAWMHIVAVWDTANGTAGNRMRLYVNGEEVTSFSTDTQPSQNEKSIWGKKNDGTDGNVAHTIGAYYNYSSGFAQGLNGYLAEVHWVEGAALAPTEFGEVDEDSGIWKPKEVDVTYGTNGFYLKFDDSSALGADSSGNSNNWSLNNIAAADQATDTPTNNFCTWNPLWRYATQPTMTDGATKTLNSSSDWAGAKATFGLTNGKWYWEYKALNYNSLNGIQTANEGYTISGNAQAVKQTMALFLQGEVEAYDFISVRDDTNVTFTFDAAHTFGIALDMDSSTQTISFYQNGSLITSGGNINIDGLANRTVFPFSSVLNNTVTVNFGGYTSNSISSAASDANGYGTFEFAPPSGYYAICSKNLAEYG